MIDAGSSAEPFTSRVRDQSGGMANGTEAGTGTSANRDAPHAALLLPYEPSRRFFHSNHAAERNIQDDEGLNFAAIRGEALLGQTDLGTVKSSLPS